MRRQVSSVAFLAGLLGLAHSASAATVSFSGSVVNTCVINITTPGLLAISTSGTSLSSDELGGASAILAVIATGTAPTLQFGAPALSGPSASTTTATKSIGYTSPGGANQDYTTSATNYTMTRLLDTLTVKAKATNTDGFVTGAYSITSTVTCQQ